ncbi:MAG: acetyl-CoA carboxylase, carboxyltransferase subunit beta [Cellulosilyticaceae bacterium]
MLSGLIGRQKKYVKAAAPPVQTTKPEIPKGMYTKCPHCKKNIYVIDLVANVGVCTYCNGHLPLSPSTRITKLVDTNTFKELDKHMVSCNPLEFEGYDEKLEGYIKKTNQNEAVVTGVATIGGVQAVVGVMDPRFIMGSMGSVVGEKITRAIEYATKEALPIILFSASGGARMQEGIFSLMQMAKTSSALARHDDKGLLYISVLTHPTTGGVTASFAMLGDIILAEPGALVGFAGPRVIEQTIRQKLPEGFQKAEFLLEHGMIDGIVERKDMRDTLTTLLKLHVKEGK